MKNAAPCENGWLNISIDQYPEYQSFIERFANCLYHQKCVLIRLYLIQYLIGVPCMGCHLKWLLFPIEVCAGVLWIDTLGVCLTYIYNKPSHIAARGRICKGVYCSSRACASSFSLGRWLITILHRISAERLS